MDSRHECHLCGSVQANVEPGYLRVVRQARRGLGSEARNFRCLCCEACLHEAGRIKALRFKVAAAMIIWLLLAPCFLAPVGHLLDAGSQAVNALILLPALLINAAGFVVGPLFLRIATRRRTEQLLGAEVDRELRRRAAVGRWGIFTELIIVRELPAGESSEEFWLEGEATRSKT